MLPVRTVKAALTAISRSGYKSTEGIASAVVMVRTFVWCLLHSDHFTNAKPIFLFFGMSRLSAQ